MKSNSRVVRLVNIFTMQKFCFILLTGSDQDSVYICYYHQSALGD